MTKLTLVLAAALCRDASCGSTTVPDPMCAQTCSAQNFSMTGDGQNAVIKDAAGTTVASRTVTGEHQVPKCASGNVSVVLTHASSAAQLRAPAASSCVLQPASSGSQVSFQMPANCSVSWVPDPTSPGIKFPIRVRP